MWLVPFLFLVTVEALRQSSFHRPGKFVNNSPRLHASCANSISSLEHNEKKYIVVTGGVISGIGKGVTASSIGVILKMMQQKPTAIKIDPYLNVDAGTMSPFEHGEVYVLDDGSETDLDLGNYERFLDVRLTNDSNLTTGKVYQEVIAKERRGDYLGKTVQIIPHITNEIIDRILSVSTKSVDPSGAEPDVCVIELGGTIGDIESMAFVEAIRQLQLRVKRENFCLVHVSMVPAVGSPPEQKTKPTQHSVKELRALGLSPDFIVCRCPTEVSHEARSKISLFCNVPLENVLSVRDVPNIYHVPLALLEQNFAEQLTARLNLQTKPSNRDAAESENSALSVVCSGVSAGAPAPAHVCPVALSQWSEMVHSIDTSQDEAVIALVGKYTSHLDAYLSVTSALSHACIATKQKLRLVMIESEHLEEQHRQQHPAQYEAAWSKLRAAQGVLVPGGFGVRGVEGKVAAIWHAREHKVPFLGICLGMQVAVIEYARHVLGRTGAHSEEFASPTLTLQAKDKAVVFMPEGHKYYLGGTMRLGMRKTILQPHSLASALYHNSPAVLERHRHRYEVNPTLVDALEASGLRFSGRDETGQRMEVLELPEQVHPFFVGTQFHPEFVSRPLRPSPMFLGLLQAVKQGRSAVGGTTSTADGNYIETVVMQEHSNVAGVRL